MSKPSPLRPQNVSPSTASRMMGGQPGASEAPVRPSINTPYHPGSDTATFRDLLLFEERLKMNAEMLRRRRRRYSAFLWSFVSALIWLGYRVLFLPPKTMVKLRLLQATLAVVLITLVLFFASGMYEEKIRYAHSYINHSNKALRPLNMHLNLKRARPSLRSLLPLPFLRSPSPPANAKPAPLPPNKPPVAALNSNRKVSGPSTVMAQIPPSANPRGELIFSSRVDRSFREGYERYRTAFEKRREEKAREEIIRSGRKWWAKGVPSARATTPTPPVSRRDTPPPGVKGRDRSPSPAASRLSTVTGAEGAGKSDSGSETGSVSAKKTDVEVG